MRSLRAKQITRSFCIGFSITSSPKPPQKGETKVFFHGKYFLLGEGGGHVCSWRAAPLPLEGGAVARPAAAEPAPTAALLPTAGQPSTALKNRAAQKLTPQFRGKQFLGSLICRRGRLGLVETKICKALALCGARGKQGLVA